VEEWNKSKAPYEIGGPGIIGTKQPIIPRRRIKATTHIIIISIHQK